MVKKSVDLQLATDPAWVQGIVKNFDAFLCDHANCERKASALAMSLVVKYPDRTAIVPALISLAQEELAHFKMVYELMDKRGLHIAPDVPDEYVKQLLALLRHGREERFLDRLLIASLIECRGAERFRLVSEALVDPELARFYKVLAGSEAKHGNLFAGLALEYLDEQTVYERLGELAAREADIVRSLPWRASLH